MTREQKLEAALRLVCGDYGRDLEPHTLVAVLNALATPPDTNTRVVSVATLSLLAEGLECLRGAGYSDEDEIHSMGFKIRAAIAPFRK